MESTKAKLVLLTVYVLTCFSLGYWHAKSMSHSQPENHIASNRN